MKIQLSDVFIPSRMRQDYGDLKSFINSISRHGQWQPIVVRPFDSETYPEDRDAPEPKKFTLLDGGRRATAVGICQKGEIPIPGLEPGEIKATFEEGLDPSLTLVLEYKINEDRKDFDWKEKAIGIRRIHSRMKETHETWTNEDTADMLDTTPKTISVYLELTKSEKLFLSEEIQSADSFRTAFKKLEILRDHEHRKRVAKHRAQSNDDELGIEFSELAEVSEEDLEALSGLSLTSDMPKTFEETREAPDDLPAISTGDCRLWLPQFPDGYFDWFHWDPPYGGNQRGGPNSIHKRIADDWLTASEVMRETVPEIYRTLGDGRWLAMWCHPSKIGWLQTYLRGHLKDEAGGSCGFCGKPWKPEEGILDSPCMANPDWHFWVNPYPNIWYKEDRKSDGHEIKRFLTNQYETFLFAAAVKENEDPILVRSDMGNVFRFPMVPKSVRRHIMHKPWKLIRAILACISVPGSRGADPSVGSGSTLEAAIISGRKVKVCELDKDYAEMLPSVAQKAVEIVSETGFQFAE